MGSSPDNPYASPSAFEATSAPRPPQPAPVVPAYGQQPGQPSEAEGWARRAAAESEFAGERNSTAVAYLLWFVVGVFGGHRFYVGRKGSAIAMLILGLTFVGLIITGIWALVDAFLIPGMIREANEDIRRRTYARYFGGYAAA